MVFPLESANKILMWEMPYCRQELMWELRYYNVTYESEIVVRLFFPQMLVISNALGDYFLIFMSIWNTTNGLVIGICYEFLDTVWWLGWCLCYLTWSRQMLTQEALSVTWSSLRAKIIKHPTAVYCSLSYSTLTDHATWRRMMYHAHTIHSWQYPNQVGCILSSLPSTLV